MQSTLSVHQYLYIHSSPCCAWISCSGYDRTQCHGSSSHFLLPLSDNSLACLYSWFAAFPLHLVCSNYHQLTGLSCGKIFNLLCFRAWLLDCFLLQLLSLFIWLIACLVTSVLPALTPAFCLTFGPVSSGEETKVFWTTESLWRKCVESGSVYNLIQS